MILYANLIFGPNVFFFLNQKLLILASFSSGPYWRLISMTNLKKWNPLKNTFTLIEHNRHKVHFKPDYFLIKNEIKNFRTTRLNFFPDFTQNSIYWRTGSVEIKLKTSTLLSCRVDFNCICYLLFFRST